MLELHLDKLKTSVAPWATPRMPIGSPLLVKVKGVGTVVPSDPKLNCFAIRFTCSFRGKLAIAESERSLRSLPR